MTFNMRCDNGQDGKKYMAIRSLSSVCEPGMVLINLTIEEI